MRSLLRQQTLQQTSSTPKERRWFADRNYFNGIAGSRLSVLFAGSTVIPTDSSAVIPKSGSVPGGAKITRPAVVSPMNSIRTRPKGYSLTVPSANSYAVFPSCLTPSFSSSSDGAIESVASGSTKNNDSNDLFESVRLVSLVVTLVNPIVPRDYYYDQMAATAATGLPLLRMRL